MCLKVMLLASTTANDRGAVFWPGRSRIADLMSAPEHCLHRTADCPRTCCLTLSVRGKKWTTSFDLGASAPSGQKPFDPRNRLAYVGSCPRVFRAGYPPISSITQSWCGLSRSASLGQVQTDPKAGTARNECSLRPMAWIRSISTCKT